MPCLAWYSGCFANRPRTPPSHQPVSPDAPVQGARSANGLCPRPLCEISLCNNVQQWRTVIANNRNNWRYTSSLHHPPGCSNVAYSLRMCNWVQVSYEPTWADVAPLILLRLSPGGLGRLGQIDHRCRLPERACASRVWCELCPDGSFPWALVVLYPLAKPVSSALPSST